MNLAALSHKLFKKRIEHRRLRIALYDRQGGKCYYCKVELALTAKPPLSTAVTLDELVPKARGGRRTEANCVAACYTCNRLKGVMSVDEFLASKQFKSIVCGRQKLLHCDSGTPRIPA